ncbi:MAG: hypothetical protein GX802_04160 [Clostridiales bacterium]|nr:hypothetical protein [Clostridiales bacterium]
MEKQYSLFEALVSGNEVIFVNSDAVTSPFFPMFVSNIIPLLIRQNKQLVVSKTALTELKKRFAEVKGSLLAHDISAEAHTYMGLYVLNKLIHRRLLCYYSDEVESGATKSMQEIIAELSGKGLLLITQNFEQTESQNVTVRSITEGGYLDELSLTKAKKTNEPVQNFSITKPMAVNKVRKSSQNILLAKKLIRTAQLALLVILSGALLVGGTLAYLTAIGAIKNTISLGQIMVDIEEPGVDKNNVEWGSFTKPVYLTVPSGSVGGVVRIMILPMFKNASGDFIENSSVALNAPIDNKIEMGDITLMFDSAWSTNWFYKDGYFYYKTVVPSGGATEKLLAGVRLTNNTVEMRAKYQDISVEIEVIADIIQPNPQAVSHWDVTLNGNGTVTP